MQINPNSALFWLPKLGDSFMVPRTIIVHIPDIDDAYGVLNGGSPKHFPLKEMQEACVSVGLPCFLRTDLASAKHLGPDAYKIEALDDLRRAIPLTLEDNHVKDLKPAAFMIRQWLDLEASFVAFGGHPIAREWRVFATAKLVLCRHFYWPRDAIRFYGRPEPTGWEKSLERLSNPAYYDSALDTIAVRTAELCKDGDESWSVDFAQVKSGRYWLIDMATATDSWHPDECVAAGHQDRVKGAQ